MFEKQKLAARADDAGESADGVGDAGDGAQVERADDGVHAGVGERDFFSGKIEKFDVELGQSAPFFGALEHSGIGFERLQFFDFGGIVKREADARAYADFEDRPLRVRNHLPADFEDGIGIAEGRDDVGIDAVAIKGHAGLGLLRKYRASEESHKP
jgi:hypothetical protein